MCVHEHNEVSQHTCRGQRKTWRSDLSYQKGPRDQTRVTRLGLSTLLSPLAGPINKSLSRLVESIYSSKEQVMYSVDKDTTLLRQVFINLSSYKRAGITLFSEDIVLRGRKNMYGGED